MRCRGLGPQSRVSLQTSRRTWWSTSWAGRADQHARSALRSNRPSRPRSLRRPWFGPPRAHSCPSPRLPLPRRHSKTYRTTTRQNCLMSGSLRMPSRIVPTSSTRTRTAGRCAMSSVPQAVSSRTKPGSSLWVHLSRAAIDLLTGSYDPRLTKVIKQYKLVDAQMGKPGVYPWAWSLTWKKYDTFHARCQDFVEFIRVCPTLNLMSNNEGDNCHSNP